MLSKLMGWEHVIAGAAFRKRLPTFLLVGSPQAGTTWLWSNLHRHPDIDVRRKEVQFWNLHYHRPIAWYASLYSPLPVRGDMTPSYAMLRPERIAVVRRVLPGVRLLFIARDPIERAWSAIRRKVTDIDVASARAFLDSTGAAGNLPGVDHSRYHVALGNWLAEFDRSRLCVVPFRQIAENPEQTFRDVLRHLGASEDRFDWDSLEVERVNVNPTADLPKDVGEMLNERYSTERERTEELVGPIDW